MTTTLLCILIAGAFAAYAGFSQAKRLGNLIENQAVRIVNNAIMNQDLLSVQTELARAGQSVKETLGSELYTELYIDKKLIAQMGSSPGLEILRDLKFVRKTLLRNQSALEIWVFPDYASAFRQWLGSVLFIFVSGLLLSFSIETVLAALMKKWLSPLIATVSEIRELTRTIERKDKRRISGPGEDINELFQLTDAVNMLLAAIESGQEEADLNHEKFLDQERRAAKDRAIAEISAVIAHDLRAPLGTIERLLTTREIELPSAVKGSIKESLNRLHSMIESFRYAEIENVVRRSPTTLDFNMGVEALRGTFERYSIELILPELPISNVMIDAAKVERSWINLVSNAVEFAKTFVRIEHTFESNELIVRVIDDGPGVPDEFLPKLFQRGSTFGKDDGTGLGLAYVRQVMRGHGGGISYYRENGLTVFECRLPQAQMRKDQKSMDCKVVTDASCGVARKKQIGICLEPKSLAVSVQIKMTEQKTEKFSFSCQYSGSESIVSNQEELLLKAMEDGKEITQIKPGLSEEKIVDRLMRKFNMG